MNETIEKCIATCQECFDQCNENARICRDHKTAEMSHCAETCTECANACEKNMEMLREGTTSGCEECARACQECADECAMHGDEHEHCRVTGEISAKCATACREALAAVHAS